jgi:2-phosphosulfolactate phosphatase
MRTYWTVPLHRSLIKVHTRVKQETGMSQQSLVEGRDPFIDGMIASRSQIPDELKPANYVVIDVTHYSTTVIELLYRGAAHAHVSEERGDEFAFKESNPKARIGGGSSEDYTPMEGYDFFNSPSSVHRIEVEGRPTALTSSNGGAAVTDLRERSHDEMEVYIGSTTNAKAIAEHLSTSDLPAVTVAAGSKGKPSPEDTVGAVLIHRYLAGDGPSESELDLYADIIRAAKAAKYKKKAEIRYRDLIDFSMAINTRRTIPKLDGQRFVDVSDEN